jgi:hypothetical protein
MFKDNATNNKESDMEDSQVIKGKTRAVSQAEKTVTFLLKP